MMIMMTINDAVVVVMLVVIVMWHKAFSYVSRKKKFES